MKFILLTSVCFGILAGCIAPGPNREIHRIEEELKSVLIPGMSHEAVANAISGSAISRRYQASELQVYDCDHFINRTNEGDKELVEAVRDLFGKDNCKGAKNLFSSFKFGNSSLVCSEPMMFVYLHFSDEGTLESFSNEVMDTCL